MLPYITIDCFFDEVRLIVFRETHTLLSIIFDLHTIKKHYRTVYIKENIDNQKKLIEL